MFDGCIVYVYKYCLLKAVYPSLPAVHDVRDSRQKSLSNMPAVEREMKPELSQGLSQMGLPLYETLC